jgi:hypothetical protein
MKEELVKRLIARASDDLIRAIHLRMVADRRRLAIRPGGELVEAWEELVDRACQEGVFDRKEAAQFLEELVGASANQGR